MPRTGDNYSLPYSPVVSGTPVESVEYNGTMADIATDLNAPRPIVAGGSGASTVDGALDNLSAEKFKQVVTNWDATVWRAGSFYAATTAIGSAPVASHAFAGIVYYRNATDLVIEATDVTDPLNPQPWVRIQAAGVWGNWMMAAGSAPNKKNYIINGAMQISQEWGTTGLGVAGHYPADMFIYDLAGTTGVVSYGQLGVVTGTNANRISFTVGTVDTTVNAGDIALISQKIEGLRCVDLKLGSSNAKTVTLRFGVRAPAGTYCVAFRNGAYNRCYVSEYTITAGEANTDTVKSVTVALDTAGTWAKDNTACLVISWTLIGGSTYQTAANVWATGDFVSTANQFNFMGTFGNVFHLFDVSLTEGSVAPPFVVPDITTELTACMRYWRFNPPAQVFWTSTTTARATVPLSPVMRATPTVLTVNGGNMLEQYAVVFINLGATTLAGYASPVGVQLQMVTGPGTNGTHGILSNNAVSFNARL